MAELGDNASGPSGTESTRLALLARIPALEAERDRRLRGADERGYATT